MSDTEKVGIEVIEISSLMATSIASPWVGLGVKSFVQEVEGLVWVDYVAVGAYESGGRG